jgi:hypothetical protein
VLIDHLVLVGLVAVRVPSARTSVPLVFCLVSRVLVVGALVIRALAIRALTIGLVPTVVVFLTRRVSVLIRLIRVFLRRSFIRWLLVRVFVVRLRRSSRGVRIGRTATGGA